MLIPFAGLVLLVVRAVSVPRTVMSGIEKAAGWGNERLQRVEIPSEHASIRGKITLLTYKERMIWLSFQQLLNKICGEDIEAEALVTDILFQWDKGEEPRGISLSMANAIRVVESFVPAKTPVYDKLEILQQLLLWTADGQPDCPEFMFTKKLQEGDRRALRIVQEEWTNSDAMRGSPAWGLLKELSEDDKNTIRRARRLMETAKARS